MTKNALNFMARHINAEHPELIAFSISPGFSDSEGGNEAAKAFGMEKTTNTLSETVPGMVKVFLSATKELNGKLISFDGSELPI